MSSGVLGKVRNESLMELTEQAHEEGFPPPAFVQSIESASALLELTAVEAQDLDRPEFLQLMPLMK